MWTAVFSRPSDASAVRRAAGLLLEEQSVPEADDVVLVVSELVTNAVLHGSAPRSIAIDITPIDVVVEVSDASSAVPVVRDADLLCAGGNGMRIVDRLATSWGVEQNPVGKTVWFRLDRSDAL